MMMATEINMMVSLAVGGDIWARGGRRGVGGQGHLDTLHPSFDHV